MLVLVFLISCNIGCGIFDPPHRNSSGYYTVHFRSCGPLSIERALQSYFAKQGIHNKRHITSKEISEDIQKNSRPFPFNGRECLVIFNKTAAQITWPSELIKACQTHGVNLKRVNKEYFNQNQDSVYIILVHKKRTLNNYHWLAHPHTPVNYFGDQTVIDRIYLLEPLQR